MHDRVLDERDAALGEEFDDDLGRREITRVPPHCETDDIPSQALALERGFARCAEHEKRRLNQEHRLTKRIQ